MILDSLSNKKILIFGFGREGRDTLSFLRKKFPGKKIGIADQKLDKNYLKTLKNYDVIIKSPGIPPALIAPFITKEQIVTSQTEIFFEECPGTIIGVTGTKGKSTTASLCYAILKHAGKKVHLVGNIGEPAFQFLEKTGPNDIFVYELSSFQLTNLKKSPHIAVFLNLYPEHLDYYKGDFNEYARAKANITKYQTAEDFLVFNKKDSLVSKIAKQSKAQKIPFAERDLVSHLETKSLSSGFVASMEPTILVGKLFGISKAKIEHAIKNFKPLPHRLERVGLPAGKAGEYKGITFINDSLATIPEATIKAIELLGPKLHTLIAGGFDRGISYSTLGKKIGQSNIETLILFPTTGERILKAIKNPPQYFFASSMEDAVAVAYQHTPKGKICLLSPASSSFNMFKDYKDRGDQFKKFVIAYGKKK